ncbi:23S rRNA (uracil(1939)-C(5))-methyltransferase RlmD [uncultured Faecalicoccus sp.]|uniref:23S rRNA (uracil(1939)-C(5))-methyltransferase RlmD n=1 Tax=uncultured Faecalicoccus sp. TaxID=1971760 RepID=UPI00261ED7E8|nr:23S rRNA (uracil(1939)-C(5))-methyltransferase RlmD [uncultured Faecalicoccus sp.]
MRCKLEKICGGCDLLHMPYDQQLAHKEKVVADLIANNHLSMKVNSIHGAEKTYGYRNKIIVAFAKYKGKIVSGLYAAHSHKVVAAKNCLMHPKNIQQIILRITELVDSMKIELYNERTQTGLLRHVLIRYAHKTNQVMICFVTGKKQFPSRRNMVNILVKEFPEIQTILQSVNSRNTSIVLENEAFVLYGDGMITDRLCDLDFTMGANSFYQIHHDQCEVLYDLAKKKLKLKEEETVLDTYCGIGTIGLSLAGECRQVTGVEINADSIGFAKMNASQNHIHNAVFVAMDSTRFMKEAQYHRSYFDAIILDPPRAGTTREFIENACLLNPKKILYISCDPTTLVRDLGMFSKKGYKAQEIDLVDMFPNTKNIESVVLLTPYQRRKK